MGWEARQRGGKYYCRSRRRPDGSVCREYIGTGPEAERIAEQDRQAREQRRRQREVMKKLEAKLAKAKMQVDNLIEQCELLLTASLMIDGYRLRKGEWRHRKNDCKRK
jgi:hypothetical protein